MWRRDGMQAAGRLGHHDHAKAEQLGERALGGEFPHLDLIPGRGPVRAAILIAHPSQEPLIGEESQRLRDDAARSRRGEPPVLGRRGLGAAQINTPRPLQLWGLFQRIPRLFGGCRLPGEGRRP